jgi:chitin disaccharide deacetylase
MKKINKKNSIKKSRTGLYYLCADDFGYSEGINEAILILAEKKILDGISVMVFGSWSEKCMNRIQSSNVELGLHLDFTSLLKSQANNKLSHLLTKSYLGLLDRRQINKIISGQINEFILKIGRPPDFIDGHQHIHQFPIIRDEMINVLNQNKLSTDFWIRSTITNDFTNLKANLLTFLGGWFSRRLFKKFGFNTNMNFLGVYSFSSNDNYREMFNNWMLKALSSNADTLIMCHPGLNKPSESYDVIFNSRIHEFEYLSSDRYHKDLSNILSRCNE